jgi:hypothetical protein
MRYKLGKTAPKAVKFGLRDYLSIVTLPTPPFQAGHINFADNNMFGNDKVGDCTCADVGHVTLYWNKEAGKGLAISTKNVLALYSAVSGYNPKDPSTDQGANMADVAQYHLTTGLEDEDGAFHKCAAYMGVTKGNIEEIKQSIYLFGACSIGWALPMSAQQQFQAGVPWSVVNRSPIEGGHDTLAIGYDPDYLYIITWGALQKVEWAFVSKYMDEGIVKLSDEMLKNGKSLEGFNVTQLQADLKAL